jgi:sugar phosphate permease
MLGFAFYMQFFQVVLLQRFGLGQSQIGFYYAYVGVWIALTQGIITRIVAKRFKPEQTLKISLLVIPLTFIIAISANQVWVLYAITVPLMAIGQGLTMPSLSTIISNLAGKESQGEAMGLYNNTKEILGGTSPEVPATTPQKTAGPTAMQDPKAAAIARLRATPGAEAYTIGNLTPNGWEVLDKTGKVVAYGR